MTTKDRDKGEYEDVACPICGRRNGHITLSRRGQHQMECHVVICPDDGMVFQSPRWHQERMMRFYREEYETLYRPPPPTAEARATLLRRHQSIIDRLNQCGARSARTILDVGAGEGAFLSYFQKYVNPNARALAIEPSESGAAVIRSSTSAKVLSQDVDDPWHQTLPNRVDLVILRHVLEHLYHPLDVLKKIESVLSDDGLLYVAVPNALAPSFRLDKLKRSFFRIVHAWYFSEPTLNYLLLRAGLEPLKTKASGGEIWSVCRRRRIAYPHVFRRQMDHFKPFL